MISRGDSAWEFPRDLEYLSVPIGEKWTGDDCDGLLGPAEGDDSWVVSNGGSLTGLQ